MKRSFLVWLSAVGGAVVMTGCGTSEGISAAPRVASLETPGEASWTRSLSRDTAAQPQQEEEPDAPRDLAAPPARMARIAGASFELDVTAVTVDAYARCVAAGKCSEPARGSGALCNWGTADRGAHPVNCVSLPQAKAYCAWSGKRLPTDAEWTMAASGVDGDRRYPWGNRPAREGRSDVCSGDELGTCTAGSHPFDATPDGVLDMGESLGEWVDGATRIRRDMGFRCARDARPG